MPDSVELLGATSQDFSQLFIWDAVLSWLPECEPKEHTLRRFIESNVGYVSLTVGADRTSLEQTITNIAKERARIEEWDECVFVENVAAIESPMEKGRLGVGFHFQGTNPLMGRLELVSLFHKLGVLQMLLVYNEDNLVGGGCHSEPDNGLTKFGADLVREMNLVGIIVDCSHTGYRTSMEAMEVSTDPVIFSHSNAWSLMPHARNIKDEQARACARTGGVVGVNGVGFFLSEDSSDPLLSMVEHIEYFAELVGPKHVGVGLDYIYYQDFLASRIQANPSTFREGYPSLPWNLVEPEQMLDLAELLMARGFSTKEVGGILGRNFLRVARRVWK